jgi:predicted regulator of Ras-like GTPase activity (Roadblock/LC7/MglB family)
MSTASQSAPFRLFGVFKGLFSKSSSNGRANGNGHNAAEPVDSALKAAPPVGAAAASKRIAASNAKTVVLPMQVVVVAMSQELRSRICAAVSDDLTVSIGIEKIVPQLGKGAVKIPFGDIRRSASHIFTSGTECDHLPVALPLSEILPRINTAALTRRPGQKQVEISNEVISPFDGRGQGLTISSESTQSAPQAKTFPPKAMPRPTIPSPENTFARRPAFPTRPATPATPAALATPAPVTARATTPNTATTFTRKPPTTPIPTIPATPVTPIARVSTPASAPATTFTRRPATPAFPATPAIPVSPIAPAAKIAMPSAPVAPISPISPIAAEPQLPESRPIAMPAIKPITRSPLSLAPEAPITPIASAPVASDVVAMPKPAAPLAPSAPAAPPLMVGLSSMMESWPETLRQEIVQYNLISSQVAIPGNIVEEGLKKGRVSHPWKTIREWLRPTPPPAGSVHDEILIDLPLKVIAPLFLAQKKSAQASQRKVELDDSIPNLFFGFPQPEAATTDAAPAIALARTAADSARPAKPLDTNYYEWSDAGNGLVTDDEAFKRKASGTEFLNRYATPNEIVSRAGALDGVAGALIALPDGLMVASKIPADLNGDTLAAFLPQLFSKMSQCTKELRMGELNNLNFTVGNVPWKIFRVNAVFFAAFGRAGEPLPTGQLAALAGELDRKK